MTVSESLCHPWGTLKALVPLKWVALVSRSLEPFSLPAADLVLIEHCTGDVTNMGEAFGLTVWVFFIVKLFLREFFFSLLSLHQRASSAGAPVSDPSSRTSGPSETMSRRSLAYCGNKK